MNILTSSDLDLEIDNILNQALIISAEESIDILKSKTPIDSGNMRDGWGYVIRENKIEFFNRMDYAKYVKYPNSDTYVIDDLIKEIKSFTMNRTLEIFKNSFKDFSRRS